MPGDDAAAQPTVRGGGACSQRRGRGRLLCGIPGVLDAGCTHGEARPTRVRGRGRPHRVPEVAAASRRATRCADHWRGGVLAPVCRRR